LAWLLPEPEKVEAYSVSVHSMNRRIRSVGRRWKSRITVLGLWHLGCVNVVGLGEIGCQVTGWDPDLSCVRSLLKGKPPLYEPGLESGIRKMVSLRRLRFVEDVGDAVKGSDIVMLAFDTPVDERDKPNLSLIWRSLEQLSAHISRDALIVVRSQIPVGTCEEINRRVKKKNRRWRGSVLCWPENLKLGSALSSFRKPAPLVIGVSDRRAAVKWTRLLKPLRTTPLITDLRSAELSKHAINAFLATCITFSNEVAEVCERTGGDAVNVLSVVSGDSRVGSKLPLSPGVAFSGGTLARDLTILSEVVPRPNLFQHVCDVNRRHARKVVKRLKEIIGGFKGKKIAVWGLTYKAGTSTLRRSLSVETVKAIFNDEGVKVSAYDPRADWDEIALPHQLVKAQTPFEAARLADVLVIMTDWPEFRSINFSALKKLMRRPVMYDPRNMFREKNLEKLGFAYYGTGRS